MDTPDRETGDRLDSRTLEIIRNLKLIPDMVADARYPGIHGSKDRGGDVEFAEHRQYEPGDDLRHLDWNALAKTDELYLKQYESETQITGRICVDASGSMDFSSHEVSKWAYARALSVLMASTLLNQNDRVHLTASQSESWASGSMSDFNQLKNHLPDLRSLSPGGPTTLLSDLKQNPVNDRAMWVLITDFWVSDLEETFRWLRGLKERGHHAVLVPVWDPVERSLEVDGAVELKDVETGETLHVGPDNRDEFLETLQSYRDRVRTLGQSAGMDVWPFFTDGPLFERFREYVLGETA
jgi:uncharacterized protein (DUF58 family)